MWIGFQKSQSEVWGSQLYQDHPGVHMVQAVAYKTPVFIGESSDKNNYILSIIQYYAARGWVVYTV